MDFSRRSHQKELLDMDNHPLESIRRNMMELNVINTYLGGHAVTIQGLKQMVPEKKQITICEIGCGGGDNLVAIQHWCQRNNIHPRFIGVDINPFCIEVARSAFPDSNARFVVSDYRLVNFQNEKIDIIFSSLFCHHFTNDQIVEMLHWMYLNSTTGFFINDLHRHPLAYYSIKALTYLFSKSTLVRNDAPLSVLRGFSAREWRRLLREAALPSNRIQWKWAFRWLILVKKDPARQV